MIKGQEFCSQNDENAKILNACLNNLGELKKGCHPVFTDDELFDIVISKTNRLIDQQTDR